MFGCVFGKPNKNRTIPDVKIPDVWIPYSSLLVWFPRDSGLAHASGPSGLRLMLFCETLASPRLVWMPLVADVFKNDAFRIWSKHQTH